MAYSTKEGVEVGVVNSASSEHAPLISGGSKDVVIFSTVPTCGEFVCCCLVTNLTCGFAFPYYFFDFHKKMVEGISVGHQSASFFGKCGEFCTSVWLPICFFNCITCNVYTCCDYDKERAGKWFDDHTLLKDGKIQPFFGRSYMPCCGCCGCCLPFFWFGPSPALILGFGGCPCVFGDAMRKMVSDYRFDDVTLNYSGSCGEYCKDVGCKFCVLNCLLCGCWSYCGGLREVGEWVDRHITAHSSSQ